MDKQYPSSLPSSLHHFNLVLIKLVLDRGFHFANKTMVCNCSGSTFGATPPRCESRNFENQLTESLKNDETSPL